MAKRILVGGLLVGILGFFALYLRQVSLVFVDMLILFFVITSAYEMSKTFIKKDYKIIKTPIIFTAISVYPLVKVFFHYNLTIEFSFLLILIVSLILTLISYTLSKRKYEIKDMVVSFSISVYPTLLFSLFFAINNKVGNLLGLLWIVMSTILTDTFAYFVGSTVKGKKLCPTISPNKTISGAIGGLLGSIIASIFIFLLFDKYAVFSNFKNVGILKLVESQTTALIIYLIFGAVLGIMAQLGDLTASRIKREIGIKDYGNIFPGHGGIMDRIDSFLFIIPSVYIMIRTISLIGG